MDVLPELRTNLLLRGVADDAFGMLVNSVTRVDLGVGDPLFREGDPGDAIFLVISGRIQVFAERDGSEVAVASFGADTYLGELALLGAETRTASARAVEPTVVLRVDRNTFAELTSAHPIVMENVSRTLVDSLVATTRAMVQRSPGEVVAVLVDHPSTLHGLAEFLGQSFVRLRSVGVAVICSAGSCPAGPRLGDDVIRRPNDETDPCYWSHDAEAKDARTFADAVAAHIDAFRREWPCTIVLGTLAELLPLLAARVFDHTFLICRDPESLESFAAADRPTESIEVVPIIQQSRRAGTWHRLLSGAALPRPTIFLDADVLSRMSDSPEGSRRILWASDQRGFMRLARAVARQRIGIAFGAGGARGFAHIGVIRFLEEHGLPIDAYAGSSIGSLVAAAHALGIDSQQAERMLTHWLRGDQRSIVRPAFSRHSILSGKGLDRTCRELFGDTRFADLDTPLAVSVADLVSGRGLIVREGPIWKAVRASCSIPAMFPPVVAGDRVLVDGGVCDPVPTGSLGRVGANIRIAVNISYSADDLNRWALEEGFEAPRQAVARGDLPNMLEAYHASFGMALADRAAASATLANVVVRPRFRVTAWHDFASGPDQLRRGYEAAERASDELRRAIPWLAASPDS
jgi:NTE family protein